MTGVDDATLAAAAIQKGVQDYIVKGSTTSSTLDRSIRDACERKHMDRESRHLK
jgi:PleD family two-component response regulator